MRLVFYGSDNFSVVSLKGLIRWIKTPSRLSIITKPNSAVYKLAKESNVAPRIWPYKLTKNEFDLGIVVSFGHLIPAACIDNCTFGMVNIHPSLLPRWRGSAPLVHTLLNHDEKTGVSLITVAKNRFDTGKIVEQKLIQESPRQLEYNELHDKTSSLDVSFAIHLILKSQADVLEQVHKYNFFNMEIPVEPLSTEMLLNFLTDVEGGLRRAVPQNDHGATMAPKVTPNMALIDFNRTAVELDCLRRAVGSFQPLATYFNGLKTRLTLIPLKENIPDVDPNLIKDPLLPGYIFYHKKRRLLAVRCLDGWVWVQSLVIDGYRRLTPNGFFAGFLNQSSCKTFNRDSETEK